MLRIAFKLPNGGRKSKAIVLVFDEDFHEKADFIYNVPEGQTPKEWSNSAGALPMCCCYWFQVL